MAYCKGCDQYITFVPMKTGGSMPCDSYGPYSIKSGGKVITQQGEVLSSEKIAGVILAYRPHWASCPKAKKFKKK